MENTYYLQPEYSSQRSFYRKAYVMIEDNKKSLYSYNTLIAVIYREDDTHIFLTKNWDYSMTTLKHLKEFFRQNNMKIYSKKDITNLIKDNTIEVED